MLLIAIYVKIHSQTKTFMLQIGPGISFQNLFNIPFNKVILIIFHVWVTFIYWASTRTSLYQQMVPSPQQEKCGI